MRSLILCFIGVLVLCSCKKDYACYGTETIEYGVTTDSTSNVSDFKLEREYEVFESCINCSKKDKDALLSMILDHLLRMEEKEKNSLEESGYFIKNEILIDNQLICEEKI